MSPSCLSLRPVAIVKLPPPLSPAMIIFSLSVLSSSALACTHFNPETQSFRPAGKGSISGAEEGHMAFLKSTIATASPCLAMHLPQAAYNSSKHELTIMPPPCI